MDDRRSRRHASVLGPRVWEAPAIDILSVGATANSSGYNADYKGLHLNKDPRISLAPPANATQAADRTSAVAPVATCAAVTAHRTWEPPAVAALSIGSTSARQ